MQTRCAESMLPVSSGVEHLGLLNRCTWVCSQVGFVPDDVSNIIKESIDTVLQNQQYSEQKVSRYNQIADSFVLIDGVMLTKSQAHSSCITERLCWLQVSQSTSACLEGCMKRLTNLCKPYKYVVTCIIMQKTGEHLCRL